MISIFIRWIRRRKAQEWVSSICCENRTSMRLSQQIQWNRENPIFIRCYSDFMGLYESFPASSSTRLMNESKMKFISDNLHLINKKKEDQVFGFHTSRSITFSFSFWTKEWSQFKLEMKSFWSFNRRIVFIFILNRIIFAPFFRGPKENQVSEGRDIMTQMRWKLRIFSFLTSFSCCNRIKTWNIIPDKVFIALKIAIYSRTTIKNLKWK
jgi:hypothetical protein